MLWPPSNLMCVSRKSLRLRMPPRRVGMTLCKRRVATLQVDSRCRPRSGQASPRGCCAERDRDRSSVVCRLIPRERLQADLGDLNSAGVRYVVIGGIALIRHGVVRATRDVNVVIAGDAENVARMRSLIDAWPATRPDGSPVPGESVAAGRTINLATPYGDLDLISERSSPLSFNELLARAEVRRIDDVEAPTCSLADLVALRRSQPM